MENSKVKEIEQGLKCCDTHTTDAECKDCPYEKYGDCTARLIADCGAYIQELRGARV